MSDAVSLEAFAAMTAEEHRLAACRAMAAADRWQPHMPIYAALQRRAQWHAAMALVEQGRGDRT